MRHAAFLIAALTIGGGARADPVRFDWTGSVAYADPSFASAGIVVGAPAYGHYRFESTTPDGDIDPQVGLYDAALREWRVAVGLIDNTFTDDPGFGSISVALDWEGMSDIYEVRVDSAVLLRLEDVDGTALASQALPLTPPVLAEFEAAVVAQLDPVTLEPLAIIAVETLTRSPAVPTLPSWAALVLSLWILASRTAVGSRRRVCR